MVGVYKCRDVGDAYRALLIPRCCSRLRVLVSWVISCTRVVIIHVLAYFTFTTYAPGYILYFLMFMVILPSAALVYNGLSCWAHGMMVLFIPVLVSFTTIYFVH